MSLPSSRPLPSWLQAGLLLGAVGLVTALLFGRAGWADWSRPVWLEGDPLEIYARVKIASEQPGHALLRFSDIARLGAPATADWSAYPIPDRLVFVLTGLLARVTGLVAAVHLMMTAIAGANAWSFYACARWLRWRAEWAAALALIFAFCTYNVRWGITLSLSQVFALPPLLLLCARATRGRGALPRASRAGILAAGLGLWLGLANPYLAFFAGVVAGGALVLALLRRTSGRRRRPLLIFLGCLGGAFLLGHADRIVHLRQAGAGHALARSADDLRVYALRPADWFVPPADHRLATAAAAGQRYFSARQGSGEFFYNYLGLAGLAGLILLMVRGAKALARRRWPAADPLLGLGWILAFGVAGGINTWLGAAGLDLFRASTRIGIYALVWALFALGGPLTRSTAGWPRIATVVAAIVLAVGAIWEQTPPLHHRDATEDRVARWHDAAQLVRDLEGPAPGPSAVRVFQLPAVSFLEAGRSRDMPDYEHLRPFLASSSLKFSYGPLRGDPVLAWAQHVARLPAPELLAALEDAGFGALWIDQRAYADHGAALAAELLRLGRSEVSRPAPLLPVRVFRLHPAAQPRVPDYDDPRLRERWSDLPDAAGRPLLLALEGWFAPETDGVQRWRWAGRDAALGLWSETPVASATIQFRLGGPSRSIVIVRHAGEEIFRGAPGPETRTLALPLAAGLTRIDWQLEGRTFVPGKNDPRELGFMVENLSVSAP